VEVVLFDALLLFTLEGIVHSTKSFSLSKEDAWSSIRKCGPRVSRATQNGRDVHRDGDSCDEQRKRTGTKAEDAEVSLT
jgi:hypothetical protein